MEKEGENVSFIYDGREIQMKKRLQKKRKEVKYMQFEGGQKKVYMMKIEKGKREIVGKLKGMNIEKSFQKEGKKVVMRMMKDEGRENIYKMDMRNRKKKRMKRRKEIDKGD